MAELSLNQISDLTGKTYRTVKGRLDNGGLSPVGKKGRSILYDSKKALACVYGKVKSDEIDLQTERALLAAEQRRKLQRENDIEEKLLAPVSLLTDALINTGKQIIPILDSLPLTMKRYWPEITGDQITMVKKSIAKCRNAIADMELDD